MKNGMFLAIAVTALLGASCSVQDFGTVVMDKPAVAASLPTSYDAAITEDDYTRYYGKYSFRYGYLSENIFSFTAADFEFGTVSPVLGDSYDASKIIYSERIRMVTPFRLPRFGTINISVASGYQFSAYALNSSLRYSYLEAPFDVWMSNGNFTFTESPYLAFVLKKDGDASISYKDFENARVMVSYSSTPLSYQPYGYGFSFDTPVTGAGSCVMDMYMNDGVLMPRNSSLAFNYFDECILYTDGYKFDFGDNSDLRERFLAEWLGAFASSTNRGFDWDNDYDDDYLVLIPLIDDYAQGAFCEFYIHDRYQAGFEDASNLLYGGIFKDARYVTLTYTKTGGAFASIDYDGFTEAFAAFRPYMYNGLLGVNEWLYNDRGGTLLPDWDESSNVGLVIQYTDEVSVTGSPLYIDVEVFTDTPASGSCSTFTPRLSNGTTPMTLNFDRSFKGLVTDYYSYDGRYTVFKGYYFTFPAQAPVCQTNYVGVLSNYAAGYLDGVNSRNAEIADLSQRIIDLQSQLSGYNGLTYDQIYQLGRQAGINAGNAANSMMSGLFGAVLSVPLSIFGGLSEFSVLGVSVMSLIISLLVVAIAVMVLKRFL